MTHICSSCGSHMNHDADTAFDLRLCAICGARADNRSSDGRMPDHHVAALCYLGGILTGILFLVMKPYNRLPVVRFHAFQSILYTAAIVALAVVDLSIEIRFPEEFLILDAIWLPVWAAAFFVWLFLMWEAYEGKRLLLPLLGPLAESESLKSEPGRVDS